MGTVEIILSIATFIFGGGGIFSTILYFRQNKRLKEIEVEKEKALSDNSWIENISKVNDEWQEIVSRCDTDKVFYRNALSEKNEEISRLNKELINLQKEYNQLQLDSQELCFWKCTATGCPNRVPPREIDIKK